MHLVPTAMGDGGKGTKQSKGVEIRSMSNAERARGRKLINLGQGRLNFANIAGTVETR